MMISEMDKERLLMLIRTEFDFFVRTLNQVPENRVGDVWYGDWSVKDMVAHLTGWERYALKWFAQAERGETVHLPEEGYTGSEADIDRLNDVMYQQDKDRPYSDILADFHAVHKEVVALVESLSEEDLFDGKRFKDVLSDPPWKLIVDNTHEHYYEHVVPLREWLNSLENA